MNALFGIKTATYLHSVQASRKRITIRSLQFLAFTFKEIQPGKAILAVLAGCGVNQGVEQSASGGRLAPREHK